MAIRGARNPMPKVKPATNSGMFSGKGPQKMDPVKQSSAVQRTVAEAYKCTNKKAGSR